MYALTINTYLTAWDTIKKLNPEVIALLKEQANKPLGAVNIWTATISVLCYEESDRNGNYYNPWADKQIFALIWGPN